MKSDERPANALELLEDLIRNLEIVAGVRCKIGMGVGDLRPGSIRIGGSHEDRPKNLLIARRLNAEQEARKQAEILLDFSPQSTLSTEVDRIDLRECVLDYLAGPSRKSHDDLSNLLWDRTTDEEAITAVLVRLNEVHRELRRLAAEEAVLESKAEANRWGKRSKTDWRAVQHRLLEMYSRDEPYTSIGNLAERLGCSKATIQKAIKNSTKLKGWQARYKKMNVSPHASSLNEFVADNTAQTVECDPSDMLTDEDYDYALRRLIEEAGPEEKARLNGLSDEEQRDLVQVFYEQGRDREPSPLEDDPPGKRPMRVKAHKRV